MAGKSRYTDEDKAKVFAALTAHDGNVKATNRDTGIPEQTIRDWKKSWERGGLPEKVQAAVPAALDDFAERTERIRNSMLDNLEAKVLNDELSGRDLITGVGVLTDKLRLVRGEATSRTEHVAQESAEDIGKEVVGYIHRALAQGAQRDEEIIDAEFEEQAPQGELPAAS